MAESPTSRRPTGWLTATAIVLVLLGAYAGGYFGLGKYRHDGAYGCPERVFPHGRLMDVYYPLGWIECRLRGDMLTFDCVGPPDFGPDGLDPDRRGWNHWVFNP
jgi:hypothetical protein